MNYTVTFLPSNISVDVPEGTLISEAAVLAEIMELHFSCGGKKTCRKCTVEIGPDRRNVLACQTRITGDLTIKVRSRPTSVTAAP